MISAIPLQPYTLRGVSVGGVYTCLQVPELDLLLDVGLVPRSFAGTDRLFVSHAHADHIGALPSLLGLRHLTKREQPLEIYLPEEVVADVSAIIEALSRLQKRPFAVRLHPMAPGDTHALSKGLWVKALRSYHPVPGRVYVFFRKINKLRTEFNDLPGERIAELKTRGEPLFDEILRPELAYATDTLITAIEREPMVQQSRVLIVESTFVDQRKSVADTRARGHIHLDEILDCAPLLQNETIALMHFSQHYRPHEIAPILDQRCPPEVRQRLIPFVPPKGNWPG